MRQVTCSPRPPTLSQALCGFAYAVIPRHIYICQVSSKFVQGFWSPWGSNFAHPITLAIGFYNSLHYCGNRDFRPLVGTWCSLYLRFVRPRRDFDLWPLGLRNIMTSYGWSLATTLVWRRYALDRVVLVWFLVIFADWCLFLQCFDTVGWVLRRASGLQKIRVVRYWHGYLNGAMCKWFAPWSSWCHCHPIISFH